MTRTTTNRPRMAAIYAPGTVRARRWHGDGDVRGYRPPSGAGRFPHREHAASSEERRVGKECRWRWSPYD